MPPLLVHDSISMSVKDKRPFPERLVRLLITLLGIGGTIWSIDGFFNFPVNTLPLTCFAIGLMLVLRLIRYLHPKFGFGCILGSFALIPIALLKFREPAIVGASGIYRIMREKILSKPIEVNEPLHAGTWDQTACMRFVFALLILAMVALLEYSDVLLTHAQSSRSGFWIRFLVTFPFLECGLYFGLQTSSIAVFMLVCFWIGTLAVARKHPASQTVEVSLRMNNAPQIQNAFTKDNEVRYSTHEPAALLLVLAAAAISAAALFSTRHFIRSATLNQKRHEIIQAYNDFSFEEFAEFFRRLPGGGSEQTVSDEVDPMNSSNPHFDGSTVLEVTVGGAAAPDDYYMRGLVRSEYTGRGWGLPAKAYRDNARLLRRLTEQNRMPQTMFHSDHVDELRTENGKYPVVHANVTAKRVELINYLPYQSVFEAGTKYHYDAETEMEDKQSYSFWLMNNAHPDWDMFSLRTAPSPDKTVSEYEKFVEKTYLSVPDTPEMNKVYNDFVSEMPQSNALLSEKLNAIRAYIWRRSEYTISPAPTPQGRDFVEYFLSEGHEGYCAHYASSAVILCRMCGIPARYVQGYVMTMGNFTAGRTDSDYRINIPDNQAHAWAEIYVQGFGWIPFEFTESVQEQWHIAPPPVTQPVTETTTTATGTSVGQGTTTTTTVTSYTATTAKTTTGTAKTGSANPKHPVSGSGSRVLRSVLRIALIAALAALGVWLWVRYHKHVLQTRSRAMRDDDPNRAADASFAFLVLLLRLQGIEQGSAAPESFAQRAENECRLLSAGRLTQAVTFQQQAVFSREGVTAEQAAAMRKTALQLAKKLYESAKPLRKLTLRWCRHII